MTMKQKMVLDEMVIAIADRLERQNAHDYTHTAVCIADRQFYKGVAEGIRRSRSAMIEELNSMFSGR